MFDASLGDDRGHSDAAATQHRADLRLRGRQRGGGPSTKGAWWRGVRLRADDAERFDYRNIGKGDKGVVLRFLVAATGISRRQMRLVRQWRDTGTILTGAAATASGPSRASTSRRTSGCWRRSTRPSGRCRGWPRARSCGPFEVFGTPVSRGWRRSPTATSTTCATPRPIAPSAHCGRSCGRRPRLSAGDRHPRPEGGPDFVRVDTVGKPLDLFQNGPAPRVVGQADRVVPAVRGAEPNQAPL